MKKLLSLLLFAIAINASNKGQIQRLTPVRTTSISTMKTGGIKPLAPIATRTTTCPVQPVAQQATQPTKWSVIPRLQTFLAVPTAEERKAQAIAKTEACLMKTIETPGMAHLLQSEGVLHRIAQAGDALKVASVLNTSPFHMSLPARDQTLTSATVTDAWRQCKKQ